MLDLDRKHVIVDLGGRREPIPIKRYWERFLVRNTAGRLYPDWITGYLPLDRDPAKNGWVDPLAFLRDHMGGRKPKPK